jgi:hypothetical protein
MYKPIATIIFLTILIGCNIKTISKVELDKVKCWGGVHSGAEISGNVSVYYFPNVKTFAKIDGCNPPSLGLVLNDVQISYMNKLMLPYSGKDIIGISGLYQIKGVAFSNAGDKSILIRVSDIALRKPNNIIVIKDTAE